MNLRSRGADKPITIRATVEKASNGQPVLDMVGWIGIDGNRYVLKAVEVAEMRQAFAALGKHKRKPFFIL